MTQCRYAEQKHIGYKLSIAGSMPILSLADCQISPIYGKRDVDLVQNDMNIYISNDSRAWPILTV